MDGILADFDSDGDLDAFIANYGQPNRLWLNDGRGHFTDSGQALGRSASHAVACGDLNNDGRVDVFVANVEDQANTVWLNQGNGKLVQTDQVPGKASSMSVALGDLDADGDLDAVLGHWGVDNQIWLNNGQGRFTLSGQTPGRAITPGIALGDLDGDLDLDIVTGGWQPQERKSANTIWLNNGRAQFQQGVSLHKPERRVHTVALADLDNDNDMDILLGFGDKGSCAAVWLNGAQGQFRRLSEVKGDGNVHGMALGDLDNDNDMDLILAQGSANKIANSIWINDGKGKFRASRLRLDRAPSNAIMIGDLDGNDMLDLFVCNYDNHPNTVWLAQSR